MIFFLLCLPLFLTTPAAQAQEEAAVPFDHSSWDQFLKKFVNEKGEVDYQAARKDPALLNAYLGQLKAISAEAFDAWPREERLALFVNAYNAGTIRLVLDRYPVKRVMDVPGMGDQAIVQIGRVRKDKPTTYSLNQIQNEFLRSEFRDEKILFALCSGAKSSPRLREEAYVGPRLEGQLYLAVREFVNDGTKNRIVPGQKKIVLSRLFKWYANDFLLNWGNFPEEIRWKPEEMAVLSFLAYYLQDSKKVDFLKEAKYKVKYEIFDWTLNDWRRGQEKG